LRLRDVPVPAVYGPTAEENRLRTIFGAVPLWTTACATWNSTRAITASRWRTVSSRIPMAYDEQVP